MKTAHHRSILLLLLAVSLIWGCSPVSEPTETALSTARPSITATSTALPTLSASATPTITATPLPLNGQQTRYFIDVNIDYYNRFVTASSRAMYTNKSNHAINEMVFIVYPAIFQAVYTRSVEFGDGTPIENFYWESHRMVIPLAQPLQPGETIEIVHNYDLYMPERGGVFSHSGKQLNLSYWFPFIPPYDAEKGWIAHEISANNSTFIGEYLVFEPADYSVALTFSDRRENFKIAAPAKAKEQDGVITYQLELARTFTLSISDQFTVVERQVGETTIQSITFNEHASVADTVADVAVQAFSLYSELYGPYGRDLLTVAEFNSDIGMEFDGIIFLSPYFYNLYPGNPRSNIHVYTAHEIAHQWFFGIVGNDQAMEPWLDEAFATYSERLFYERFYQDHLDWYWENYVTGHNPHGKIDITIYFGGDLFEYRDIVYRNGALFLHDLRAQMGDEVFFNFIQAYVNKNRHQIATSADFFSLLDDYADSDLSPLIEDYFSLSPTS